jgi:hypothetical protein
MTKRKVTIGKLPDLAKERFVVDANVLSVDVQYRWFARLRCVNTLLI